MNAYLSIPQYARAVLNAAVAGLILFMVAL